MSPSARDRKKQEPSGAAGGLPFLLFILDSHEKQPESAFHGASAHRSLNETASAPRAQKGDAFSGTFPIKSVCFLSENRMKTDGSQMNLLARCAAAAEGAPIKQTHLDAKPA